MTTDFLTVRADKTAVGKNLLKFTFSATSEFTLMHYMGMHSAISGIHSNASQLDHKPEVVQSKANVRQGIWRYIHMLDTRLSQVD